MPLLSGDEVLRALASMRNWAYEGGELFRRFRFRDFTDAFGFVVQAAAVQHQMGHYGSVTHEGPIVMVTIASQGGVSDLDLELARRLTERSGKAY